jgi:hypothetical protein
LRHQIKNYEKDPCIVSILFFRTYELLYDTESTAESFDEGTNHELVAQLLYSPDFSILRTQHLGFKSRHSIFRTGPSVEMWLELYDDYNFMLYPKVANSLQDLFINVYLARNIITEH